MKTDYGFLILSVFSKRLFKPRARAHCISVVAPDPLWTLMAYSFSFLFGLATWTFAFYILMYCSNL